MNQDTEAVLLPALDQCGGFSVASVDVRAERLLRIQGYHDLERVRPAWRTPVQFSYRGHRVWSMPPSSSGGVTLALAAQAGGAGFILPGDKLMTLDLDPIRARCPAGSPIGSPAPRGCAPRLARTLLVAATR